MPDTPTSGHRVDRMQIRCRTTQRTSSTALDWRRRLEAIARAKLASALEKALRAIPEAQNGKVLHIPVVELDFTDVLKLATSDDASLAAAWAKQIASEVRKTRQSKRFASKSALCLAALKETSTNVRPRQFWKRPLSEWNPEKPEESWLRAAGNLELPPPFCWLTLLDSDAKKKWAADVVRGSTSQRWWQSLPRSSRARLFALLNSPESWPKLVPAEGSLPAVESIFQSPNIFASDVSSIAQPDRDPDVPWPDFVRVCKDFAGAESFARQPKSEPTDDEPTDIRKQDGGPDQKDDRKIPRKSGLGWDIELETTMAGAVLLWPFLDTFFKTQPDATPIDRLGMLHLLVTGEAMTDEPIDPVLALLAGVDPTEPETDLACPSSFADHERVLREAEQVLAAFANSIRGASGTSARAMRETFLLRPGTVCGRKTDAGTTWLIRIEPRGVDVLLSTLPYPTSIIKLPWTGVLNVEREAP